jgi:hypothetical protein
MGHQRAIATGLCYCHDFLHESDGFIVMDGDGEDDPNYIPKLIDKLNNPNPKICFAKRTQRSEGLSFRFFYQLYKITFKTLTGKTINFGNYSIIPTTYLKSIVNLPEIWNHYSAAIIKSNLYYSKINTKRGRRYCGKSQMNLPSLIIHGFSSFSVYSELILTRFCIFSLLIFIINIISFLVILYLKIIEKTTSPGWATSVILNSSIISIIIFAFSFLAGLSLLNQRNMGILNNSSKIYQEFIDSVTSLAIMYNR